MNENWLNNISRFFNVSQNLWVFQIHGLHETSWWEPFLHASCLFCYKTTAHLRFAEQLQKTPALLHFTLLPLVQLEIVQARNAFNDVVTAAVLFKKPFMAQNLEGGVTVSWLIKLFQVKCPGHFLLPDWGVHPKAARLWPRVTALVTFSVQVT